MKIIKHASNYNKHRRARVGLGIRLSDLWMLTKTHWGPSKGGPSVTIYKSKHIT